MSFVPQNYNDSKSENDSSLRKSATREKLINFILACYHENFSQEAAAMVINLNAINEIYLLATDYSIELSKAKKQALIFRAAYTLEYIYFNHHELFKPHIENFINDFPLCNNESAKRHFTKIMADLLSDHIPTVEQMNKIGESASAWIIKPKVKVAVKIGSMAVLKLLYPHLPWLRDMWKDLNIIATSNATPAIQVRIKRDWGQKIIRHNK